MMAKQTKSFIPRPDFFPQIYVYEDKRELGKLKIGYTTRKNPLDRIKEQYGATIASKEAPYKLLWKTDAIKEDGSYFTDKAVHRYLKNNIQKFNIGGAKQLISDHVLCSRLFRFVVLCSLFIIICGL